MGTATSAGRAIAVLVLAQVAGAMLSNRVLLSPVITTPPGFLENAAGSAVQMGLCALIGLATGALSIAIAIAAWPVFRRHSEAMALWLLALAVAGFAITAVENMGVMSMLSLSQAYAKAGAADAELFQTLRVVVGSARNWAHYINVIVASGMIFVLYAALFRFALVPRALGAFGMLAALLQLTAVTFPLFGQRSVMLLIAPLGLSHLALALWLLAKGLRSPEPPLDSPRRQA